MSLDYPNRQEWLAVRATPKRLPQRWFFVSTRENFRLPRLSMAGQTYNVGRNKAKRIQRAKRAAAMARAVAQ